MSKLQTRVVKGERGYKVVVRIFGLWHVWDANCMCKSDAIYQCRMAKRHIMGKIDKIA